jgi:hypothetical protein
MSANNPELIRAHFDGEHIMLDDPVELKRNAQLLVTVVPNNDEEHEAWLRVVTAQLDTAYNGESDDYALESIKEMNPDYEGR